MAEFLLKIKKNTIFPLFFTFFQKIVYIHIKNKQGVQNDKGRRASFIER